MKLKNIAEHERHPWVIRDVVPDFTLLDVWEVPVDGGRDDFGALVDLLASFDVTAPRLSVSHVLFRARLMIGAVLGWDDPTKQRPIPGCTETSLAERLPRELRATSESALLAGGASRPAGGFKPLYRTADECAAEISNETVHGVLHLGWVHRAAGRYRAQMAVYVKPRGTLGRVYLELIRPFRHLVVYPALMRRIGHAWDERSAATVRSAR